MTTIARGQASDCATPLLELFTQVNGLAVDVYSLEFQIFDRSTGTPTQVYPATPGQRQAVNVADPCPLGDKLAKGHYVARWTVPGGENVGAHEIRWFVRVSSSSSEQGFVDTFDVVATLGIVTAAGQGYATISEARAEGITTAQADDARLYVLLDVASRFIDRVTGQWFAPRERTISLDGANAPGLLFRVPIVAVRSLLIDGAEVPAEDYVVYNRHLSQGLLQPDDRKNPRIMRRNALRMAIRSVTTVWPAGYQNITVEGVFGYTDPADPFGGVTQGVTPALLKRLCLLLVVRELEKIGSADRQFSMNAGRLVSERTRDQSYTLSAVGSSGRGSAADITGDPEIDGMIALFRAPIAIGSSRGTPIEIRPRGGWWR